MNDQLLSTLENSKRYTLAVADAMPENTYFYKPQGAGWTFAELLNHISYGISWWEENYIKGTEKSWNPPTPLRSKKEIIADITRNYDALKKTISALSINEKSMRGFNATLDHITHHRGQAVLFLRLNGIEPPEYTY